MSIKNKIVIAGIAVFNLSFLVTAAESSANSWREISSDEAETIFGLECTDSCFDLGSECTEGLLGCGMLNVTTPYNQGAICEDEFATCRSVTNGPYIDDVLRSEMGGTATVTEYAFCIEYYPGQCLSSSIVGEEEIPITYWACSCDENTNVGPLKAGKRQRGSGTPCINP